MSTPAQPDEGLMAKLRDFVRGHPEVLAGLTAAAEGTAEAAAPPSMYEAVHAAVDAMRGIDDVRREELHAATERHQAEHQALLEAVKPSVPESGPAAAESGNDPEPAAAPPEA
jgi:hypothetical protein